MLRPRIIPSLLLRGGALVKTVRFSSPQYVGDPLNAVRIFNEKEVDELVVFDIGATVDGREIDYELVGNLAAECRMPLCYGGGVKSVVQADRIISLGVEKVAVSSSSVASPELVSAMVDRVGGQSVVVVLDVKEDGQPGHYEVRTHNGLRGTGRSPVDLAREVEKAGAAEVVINSIDRDGVMGGYDLMLAQMIRNAVSLPMTMLGGAGSLQHIAELIGTLGIVGAAAGSLFVFKGPYRAVLINYPDLTQREALYSTSWSESSGQTSLTPMMNSKIFQKRPT